MKIEDVYVKWVYKDHCCLWHRKYKSVEYRLFSRGGMVFSYKGNKRQSDEITKTLTLAAFPEWMP